LSKDMLRQYAQEGFILLHDLLSEADLLRYSDEVTRLRDDIERSIEPGGVAVVTTSCHYLFEPSTRSLRSVFDVHITNDVLKELCCNEAIVSVARQILADEVYIHQCRINYQPAFVGTGFWWHSDFETWHSEDGMPTPRALSVMVMLDGNAPENGALMVMPGSHQAFVQCPGLPPERHWEQSLAVQSYGTPSRAQLRELASKYSIRHCKGGRGSVLVFDSNLIHGSHSNITPFDRRNLFQVFNAVSNRLVQPFESDVCRPEHVAHRDPAHTAPIVCRKE